MHKDAGNPCRSRNLQKVNPKMQEIDLTPNPFAKIAVNYQEITK